MPKKQRTNGSEAVADPRWFAKPKDAHKDPVTVKLKAEFDAAHERGEVALKAHDWKGVNEAIAREQELIQQQVTRINEFVKHKK